MSLPHLRRLFSTLRRSPPPPSTRRDPRAYAPSGPYEVAGVAPPHYPKRRSPLKRSSALISLLQEEEMLRLVRQGRAVFPTKVPDPRAGDVIRVSYSHSLADTRPPLFFTGICIAVRRRGLASAFVLRNVVEGVPVERGFPMYSPLIRDAEVLAHKKVRRAKLYYLRHKPLKESTVPDATRRPKPA